ncbi:MAG: hypothetical protein AB7O73_15220, partial [Bacteroidia bacterium]
MWLEKQIERISFFPFFLISSIAFYTIVVLRAKTVPFTHDETATFYYFIQNGHYMPFYAHLDTNNHILNSMLTHWSYQLFGDSKFALRLPNLIFTLFFIYGTYKVSGHLKKNISKIVLILFFFFSYNWVTFFSVSRGYGLSFASMAMGISFCLSYFKTGRLLDVILFCFWMQLALAASLIILPVFCIFLGLVLLYQFS